MARSKYELTHWAKSILTHYFMEIFVDKRIVKTLALLYILQHLIGVHDKQPEKKFPSKFLSHSMSKN